MVVGIPGAFPVAAFSRLMFSEHGTSAMLDLRGPMFGGTGRSLGVLDVPAAGVRGWRSAAVW